jgi:hypothetical protein
MPMLNILKKIIFVQNNELQVSHLKEKSYSSAINKIDDSLTFFKFYGYGIAIDI